MPAPVDLPMMAGRPDTLELIEQHLQQIEPLIGSRSSTPGSREVARFVAKNLSDFMVKQDKWLAFYLNHGVPSAVDREALREEERLELGDDDLNYLPEGAWDYIVRKLSAPIEADVYEQIQAFLAGRVPHPFPLSEMRQAELDKQSEQHWNNGEYGPSAICQREIVLHNAWQRLSALPAFQAVMTAFHRYDYVAVRHEQVEAHRLYARYRKSHPCPIEWTESMTPIALGTREPLRIEFGHERCWIDAAVDVAYEGGNPVLLISIVKVAREPRLLLTQIYPALFPAATMASPRSEYTQFWMRTDPDDLRAWTIPDPWVERISIDKAVDFIWRAPLRTTP